MATGGLGIDEVDLIDLEHGVAASSMARASVSDATPEEQEHLLDVCPPKLEQKLSLTRRNHDHLTPSDKDAAGNVLVTLGHDQVVPVRKRIDVVSSDTIKRVRDITKNLEPVMGSEDRVDYGSKPSEDEASYEAKEINDAFNFLAELDDNEEQEDCEQILGKRSVTSYPLEPTCFIEEPRAKSMSFDNEAFEASPPGKDKRPSSLSFDFEGLRAARNSFKRLRSFTCSAVGLDVEPWRKRSKQCPYRKSWSEGSGVRRLRSGTDSGVSKRRRTNSERLDEAKASKKGELASRGQSVTSIG